MTAMAKAATMWRQGEEGDESQQKKRNSPVVPVQTIQRLFILFIQHPRSYVSASSYTARFSANYQPKNASEVWSVGQTPERAETSKVRTFPIPHFYASAIVGPVFFAGSFAIFSAITVASEAKQACSEARLLTKA